jgi:hypothetical protein
MVKRDPDFPGAAYSVRKVFWFAWRWRLRVGGGPITGLAISKRAAKSAARWAMRRRRLEESAQRAVAGRDDG